MKSLFTFILLIGIISCTGASVYKSTTGITGSGTASWYGDKFHGKMTASGQKHNKHKLTAAHRTLPFGTKVRVTNKKSKKSVVVTVNDRGPFVKNRVMDLSKAAFKKIASLKEGVIEIGYEVIE